MRGADVTARDAKGRDNLTGTEAAGRREAAAQQT